ncbi:hypothetical protein ZWY2020_044806 [Hordeum vulgare]|nr:hypothetical protein ZWY2020_044806 [Hordeum vulgare]
MSRATADGHGRRRDPDPDGRATPIRPWVAYESGLHEEVNYGLKDVTLLTFGQPRIVQSSQDITGLQRHFILTFIASLQVPSIYKNLGAQRRRSGCRARVRDEDLKKAKDQLSFVGEKDRRRRAQRGKRSSTRYTKLQDTLMAKRWAEEATEIEKFRTDELQEPASTKSQEGRGVAEGGRERAAKTPRIWRRWSPPPRSSRGSGVSFRWTTRPRRLRLATQTMP